MENQEIIDENQVFIEQHLKENTDVLPNIFNVILTDLKGEILFEQQNTSFIDISILSKGFYIIFLTDSEGGLIKKIKVIKK